MMWNFLCVVYSQLRLLQGADFSRGLNAPVDTSTLYKSDVRVSKIADNGSHYGTPESIGAWHRIGNLFPSIAYAQRWVEEENLGIMKRTKGDYRKCEEF